MKNLGSRLSVGQRQLCLSKNHCPFKLLFFPDLKKIIHAFIPSCRDFCASLYTEFNQGLLSRLQLVNNAAAWSLTETKERVQHTTAGITSLSSHSKCCYLAFNGFAAALLVLLIFSQSEIFEVLRSDPSFSDTASRSKLKSEGWLYLYTCLHPALKTIFTHLHLASRG